MRIPKARDIPPIDSIFSLLSCIPVTCFSVSLLLVISFFHSLQRQRMLVLCWNVCELKSMGKGVVLAGEGEEEPLQALTWAMTAVTV